MSSLLKWIIFFMILGAVVVTIFSKVIEGYWIWSVISIVALGVIIWLFFKWQRSMRLEKTTVGIQFLDD